MTQETKSFEKKAESFFNANLLKIIGIVYTIATPFFVWLVISIFNMQSEINLIKYKVDNISEIKDSIKVIQQDLNLIKIDIAVLKKETK